MLRPVIVFSTKVRKVDFEKVFKAKKYISDDSKIDISNNYIMSYNYGAHWNSFKFDTDAALTYIDKQTLFYVPMAFLPMPIGFNDSFGITLQDSHYRTKDEIKMIKKYLKDINENTECTDFCIEDCRYEFERVAGGVNVIRCTNIDSNKIEYEFSTSMPIFSQLYFNFKIQCKINKYTEGTSVLL